MARLIFSIPHIHLSSSWKLAACEVARRFFFSKRVREKERLEKKAKIDWMELISDPGGGL